MTGTSLLLGVNVHVLNAQHPKEVLCFSLFFAEAPTAFSVSSFVADRTDGEVSHRQTQQGQPLNLPKISRKSLPNRHCVMQLEGTDSAG
jgi:hypothetical protein